MSDKVFGFTFSGEGENRKVVSLNGTNLEPGMLHVLAPLPGDDHRLVSEEAVVAADAAYAFAADVQRDSKDLSKG
jgi:hypothetical protein